MALGLLIDLDKCTECGRIRECAIECSYPFHPSNTGITAVREAAAFAGVCRRCEEGTCIDACPRDALERDEQGVVHRHNLRCISCGSCVLACPFGTIQLETIPYALSLCDVCEGRLAPGELPVCIGTCPENALSFVDLDSLDDEWVQRVTPGIAVRAVSWRLGEERAAERHAGGKR